MSLRFGHCSLCSWYIVDKKEKEKKKKRGEERKEKRKEEEVKEEIWNHISRVMMIMDNNDDADDRCVHVSVTLWKQRGEGGGGKGGRNTLYMSSLSSVIG